MADQKLKRFGLESVKSLFKLIMEKVGEKIQEIKTSLSNVYVFKGSKATYQELPGSGNTSGDVYNVEAAFEISGKKYPAGTNVAWTGTAWDPLGGETIDTSGFLTEASFEEYSEEEISGAIEEAEAE